MTPREEYRRALRAYGKVVDTLFGAALAGDETARDIMRRRPDLSIKVDQAIRALAQAERRALAAGIGWRDSRGQFVETLPRRRVI